VKHQHTDPWAPLPGFEPYERPQDDGFSPMCSKASDLGAFLRSNEVQEFLGPSTTAAVEGSVMLPDGTPAQLTQKPDGTWELMTHIRRDLYRIFSARTRDEVLRMAGAGS
jgi:hypothetical protein